MGAPKRSQVNPNNYDAWSKLDPATVDSHQGERDYIRGKIQGTVVTCGYCLKQIDYESKPVVPKLKADDWKHDRSDYHDGWLCPNCNWVLDPGVRS